MAEVVLAYGEDPKCAHWLGKFSVRRSMKSWMKAWLAEHGLAVMIAALLAVRQRRGATFLLPSRSGETRWRYLATEAGFALEELVLNRRRPPG